MPPKATPAPAAPPPKSETIIPLEELEIHCHKHNGWIALNGKVFSIEHYIESHPGGVSTIVKGLGKDATELFNSVHPYVDFEAILKGHQVGILGKGEKEKPEKLPQSNIISKGWLACCSCCYKQATDVPEVEMYESKLLIVFVVSFTNVHSVPTVLMSDWTIGLIKKQTLIIRKIVDRSNVFVIQIKLTHLLNDDTLQVQFGNSYKTLEIKFIKPVKGRKWKTLGKPEGDNGLIVDSRAAKESYDACIVYKEAIAKNTYMFGIRLAPNALFGIPIGFHIYIIVNGIRRPYTPVCYSLILEEQEPNLGGGPGDLIWFIIKIYPKGELTTLLDKIPITTSPTPEKTLLLSPPGGNFELEWLWNKRMEVLILMAGGTGITPMTRIVHTYIQKVRKAESSKHVMLLYWSRTEEDIIWKDRWNELKSYEYNWFHYFPILTEPGPKWKGLVGRPTNKQIQDILDTLNFELSTLSTKQGVICGPSGFNSAVEEAINGILTLDNVHIFAG